MSWFPTHTDSVWVASSWLFRPYRIPAPDGGPHDHD